MNARQAESKKSVLPAKAGIQVKFVSVNEYSLDSVFTGMTKVDGAGYSIRVWIGTTVEGEAHEQNFSDAVAAFFLR